MFFYRFLKFIGNDFPTYLFVKFTLNESITQCPEDSLMVEKEKKKYKPLLKEKVKVQISNIILLKTN